MKPVLYVHGGSGNHGCEAIVRTLTDLLHNEGIKEEIIISANVEEDKRAGLTEHLDLRPIKTDINRWRWDFIYAYIQSRFFGNHVLLDALSKKKIIATLKDYDVAMAIGGDTYSYGYSEDNTYTHNLFRKRGMKTMLWGCSIEPSLLNDARVIKDLKNFDVVTARESVTYKSLKDHGIQNIYLFPDLAFTLKKKECDESSLIKKGKTIGINVSPLVQKYQRTSNIVFDNYKKIIEYILSETDNDVALIPHVVWPNNDDREAMQTLFNLYKESGRVIQIADHNCMELKDIISRCRLFVCARTHASIAAYSSCVPTLVLGYSVKAQGIAMDLFGTDDNYVIPVQSLNSSTDMVDSLKWLIKEENAIRSHLMSVMPSYVASTKQASVAIKSLL